ncbi:SDR family NAD(P)-dependent oxidoreductase [Pontibaca salina]|uniref:SDR family NAD(P)-dependent oxidoreductase n=1 Tax=Pontibaca salina TaxID=2795731 RepID=A0A934M1F5_9RHOB|nr:SDR family NAD(P)-dependent oxidoreductase [Pontibaca salina]MBI6630985.1 SDR family NAD(P)-dependent oxidoreductase [Pontibaca salina]
MKRALVVGASGGIGSASVQGLQRRGHQVATLSRSADAFDITDEDSIIAAMARVSGPFETVIVATGALEVNQCGPEKQLKALRPDALAAQFALNAAGPALMLNHVLQHMPRDRRTVFAALSARVGSIGDNRLGGWYSYRASKAALNQLIHTAAIEVARSHPHAICVLLHPGTVATRFTANYPNHAAVPAQEAASNLIGVIENLSPSQSGGFFDWRGAQVAW